MERMKPHALEAGADGQVLRTVDGDTAWGDAGRDVDMDPLALDNLTDVDTSTTAPTAGQSLVFDDASGQWVPGSLALPGTETNVEPDLVGAVTVHRADGPYDVPLPPGVDETLDGKFVLVAHWLSTPPATLADLLALTEWEVLAYTGTHRVTASGPFMAILGGDPMAAVELAAGDGACELSLLAFEGATGFRGLPLPTSVVIDACDSAVGWTTPYGKAVTGSAGAVKVPVGESVSDFGKAVVTRAADIDVSATPIIAVEWKAMNPVSGAYPSPIMFTINPYTPWYEPAYDFGVELFDTVDLEDGWKRSLYDASRGNDPRPWEGGFRLVHDAYDSSSAATYLLIRDVTAHPSPAANVAKFVSSSLIYTGLLGVRAEVNDVLVVVGGADPQNVPDDKLNQHDVGGGGVLATKSGVGNPSLSTRVWTVPVPVAGPKKPTLNTFGTQYAGLLVGVAAVHGPSEVVGGPGGGASTLDELTDVDTTGVVAGQVLTYDGDEWVADDAPGAGSGLIAEEVRDLLAAVLTEGSNVTITVDDPGDTITIAAADTNTTDPEVVRDTVAALLAEGTGIELTYDDGTDQLTIASTVAPGLTLEQVQDAVAAMLVEGSNVDLTYDDVAGTITVAATGGGGGGGGAADLDDLTDVDVTTVAPTAGQVLVFDAVSGLWKPGKGGPEVGAWENNLEQTFVYPALVEHDLQAAPPAWPTARPAVAPYEVTVTSDMLVTSTGANLGHETLIHIMLLGRMQTAGSGNLVVEGAVWKAATNTEVVGSTAQAATVAVNGRIALSVVSPVPVAVGDKVRLRLWSSNGANIRVDWWAHRSLQTRMGNQMDSGRICMFRDVVITGNIGAPTPSTVLTLGANSGLNTWAASGSDATRDQWLDNGVLIQQNGRPAQSRTILAAPLGVMGVGTLGDGMSGTSTATVNTSTTQALVHPVTAPTQLRVDRLYVPAPPT